MSITETTSLLLNSASQTGSGWAAEVSQRKALSALVDVRLPQAGRLVHGHASIARRVVSFHRAVHGVPLAADALKIAYSVVRAISVDVVNLIRPAPMMQSKRNAVSQEVLSLEPSAPVAFPVDDGKRGLAGAFSSYDPGVGIVRKGGLQFFNHATSYHRAEVA